MRAPTAAVRVLAGGALTLSVIVVAVLLLSAGPGYRVRLLFSDASGLVTGDQVMIGPSSVGSVRSIALTRSGQAAIVIGLSSGAAPLHRGTAARIEDNGLAGIASHYITLEPAAASAPLVHSGGTIPETDTHAEVSLDQLFDALNAPTRTGLRNIIRGAGTSIAGKSAAANATIHYLAPLLQSGSEATAELARSEPAFDQLLVSGAQTMQRLASRSEQLSALVSDAEQSTGALAEQSAALRDALAMLPEALNHSSTTFTGLRATLRALTPLVNVAKPAVTKLPRFSHALLRFAQVSAPTLTQLATLIGSPSSAGLTQLLARAPQLERAAARGFPAIITSLHAQQSSGQLGYLLAYTPDIVAALTNIGQASGYYDANGHYARVEPFYGAYGISGGELTDTLPTDTRNGNTPDRYGGLTVVSSGRCPGGATQPADGSMPEQLNGTAGTAGCDASNHPGG